MLVFPWVPKMGLDGFERQRSGLSKSISPESFVAEKVNQILEKTWFLLGLYQCIYPEN